MTASSIADAGASDEMGIVGQDGKMETGDEQRKNGIYNKLAFVNEWLLERDH